MEEPNWHARQFKGDELQNIFKRLAELIEQKGYDQINKVFSAADLVGKHTIDWEKDPALSAIILRYRCTQKTHSTILGRILFQMLLDETSKKYEFIKESGAFYAKYRRF